MINEEYYKSLLRDNKVDENIAKIINADLARTIPCKTWNYEDSSQLKNILYSYAIHNPAIGYCQGMNDPVAFLLESYDEIKTFFIFCKLIESLPITYHSNLIDSECCRRVFGCVLARTLKPISQKIE